MNGSLHIDVVQKRQSRASKEYVKTLVEAHLGSLAVLTAGSSLVEADLEDNKELRDHVQNITICDALYTGDVSRETPIVLHIHTLDLFGAQVDCIADATSGEELSACEVWGLPHEEFHGLWESLVYESQIKADALRFVETAFEFVSRGVDPRQVAWNRVVLLHGPPGTGKTSLCRALAHKLAVRLSDRFPRARLLEINAHSLFSKWFSESGKLVTKLFDRINEIVDDPRLLACILVDEVESLTHARNSALAGLEPSDSIRAVNAVLTALDRLRRRPNALLLATSNVTGAIDVAFIDRADLKRRVGPPGERAAYEILRGACAELIARGVVSRGQLFTWRVLEASRFVESEAARASLQLRSVARAAASSLVSARALRRLPFLARALHTPLPPAPVPSLDEFVRALRSALDCYIRDETELTNSKRAESPRLPCDCNQARASNGLNVSSLKL